MNTFSDSCGRAFTFAAHAHLGQIYPGTGLPYLYHISMVCIETMGALRTNCKHDESFAIQVACLHDVLEDTDIPYSSIENDFGKAVADGVLALTKDSTLPSSARMADSISRILTQANEVKIVKLADRICNLGKPPHSWDRERIIRYRDESLIILERLGHASSFLSERLSAAIETYGMYA